MDVLVSSLENLSFSVNREDDENILQRYMEEKLKYYTISWVIDNFYIQSCKENWKIFSPELLGPQEVKLQLCLKRTPSEDDQNPVFCFILRRSDSDCGPAKVWVELRVEIHGPYDAPKFIIKDRLCALQKGEENESIFTGMDLLFENKKGFELDKLTVDCKVLIYTEEENGGLPDCADDLLRSLSEDLLALYEAGSEYDIELTTANCALPVHRAILSCRIPKMHELIAKEVKRRSNEEIKVFDVSHVLPNSDFEAMKRVMAFIYSGNLKHVLERPSISIHDWATIFEIDEIKGTYVAENLSFVSPSDADVFTYTWEISDFHKVLENGESLHSSVLAEDCSSRTWEFHFCPKTKENTDFVALIVETNEEIEAMNVWLEISIVNNGEHVPLIHKFRRKTDGSRVIEFNEFSYKNWVKLCAVDDSFHLAMKIEICSDEHSEMDPIEIVPTKTAFRDVDTYDSLSVNMNTILQASDFYDGAVECEGLIHMIHKCVLRSRCAALYMKLQTSNRDEPSVLHENELVLRVLLKYIYTATIDWNILSYRQLLDVYKAAFKLELLPCKEICLKLLTRLMKDSEIRMCQSLAAASVTQNTSLEKQILKGLKALRGST